MGQCVSSHFVSSVTKKSVSAASSSQHLEKANTADGNVDPPGCRTSPFYISLPSETEKAKVRNVSDGDLTLTDKRCIRLLGVDTPKEQQPFALETKAYMKDLCEKKNIWISYEPGQSKEERDGGLLTYVWVQKNQGYLCVNEGLVSEGFAPAYVPNPDSKLSNWDKFVALQDEARAAGRGRWADFVDFQVYKARNGSSFHKKRCTHLQSIDELTELNVSEASSLGLNPCRACFPKDFVRF